MSGAVYAVCSLQGERPCTLTRPCAERIVNMLCAGACYVQAMVLCPSRCRCTCWAWISRSAGPLQLTSQQQGTCSWCVHLRQLAVAEFNSTAGWQHCSSSTHDTCGAAHTRCMAASCSWPPARLVFVAVRLCLASDSTRIAQHSSVLDVTAPAVTEDAST